MKAYRKTPIFMMRNSVSKASLDKYIEVLASVDTIHYIEHASPATLFFQFAKHDVFISKEEADAYFNAASEPKRIEWYDSYQIREHS